MYETLSLNMLNEARLEPDWMTLHVGMRGIELGAPYDCIARLPRSEVQDYALDRIEKAVGTPDAWNIYRVADGEYLPHRTDVEEALHSLAISSGVPAERARRKWRLAVVTLALPGIAAEHEGEAEYGGAEHLLYLHWEWRNVCSSNHFPATDFAWGDDLRRLLNAYNEWRETEYAAIAAEGERLAVQ